jgi:predicted nucleic-acid-binding protein
MTALLDTNVILRFLLGGSPEQVAAAHELFESDLELILTDMVVAECEWVLRSSYGLERQAIAGLLGALISLRNLIIPGEDVLSDAINKYRWTRVDFTDAYLAASALSFGTDRIASFDRNFDQLPQVKRIP